MRDPRLHHLHQGGHTGKKARGAAGLVAAALLFLGPAACSVIAGLDKLDFNPQGQPCSSASACDDQNPCTDDACSSDNLCTHTAVPDGPSEKQIPGDCHAAACAAGQIVQENDDTDIPDDHNDCTIDGCSAGQASHTPKGAGVPCTEGSMAGTCDAFGKCQVTCGPTQPCDDKNPCTTDTCDMATSMCVFDKVMDGTPTPGVMQVPGDCHQHLCQGGMDTNAVDDQDLPLTPGTDCDDELCANGVPSNLPKAQGVSCMTNGGKLCDGAGACIECLGGSDCHSLDTDCVKGVCQNFKCVSTFQPAGTACGKGMTQSCDANGQCTCASDMQCAPPDTCGGGNPGTPGVCGCTKTTCAAQSKTCGAVSDACGGMLSCNDGMKDGTETDVDCGGGTTCAIKCAQGKKCAANSDCTSNFCVDGVCCNSACAGACQACTAAKKGAGADGACGSVAAGTDPDNECTDQGAATCGTNGVCDGAGACAKYAAGTTCVAAFCNGSTLNKADTCNASNMCVDGGAVSCAPYTCKNAACLASCAADTDCDALHYCAMSVCVAKQVLGAACAVSSHCASGNCVDGVCCDSVCSGTCQACNVAGSIGTCSNVPAGQNDDTCLAPMLCNGAGLCQ